MAYNVFTDAQIQEIMKIFAESYNAEHKQYIGARYVPIFGRKNEDTIEWDNKGTYEPLTIVLHEGNSYTSRQFVPVGVDILNQEYWANTGNYNAQVEQYRQEVFSFDGRITKNTNDIAKNTNDIEKNTNDITKNTNDIEKNTNGITKNTNNIAKNTDDITKNTSDIDMLKNPIMVVFGDSWSDFLETESNWTNLVAKQLGCRRKNYSKSGATITDIGEKTIKTLETEVDEAVNELSDKSSYVKYVFILMGVNDITHDKTDADILPILSAQTTRIRNAFPYALISFSFNFPCYNQAKYMPHVGYFKQFAFNRGYRYVDLGSLMFAPSLYKTDKLHPTNGAGTGYIAGRMLGSQCNVSTDDYVIKNDSDGIITIKYTQLGPVLFVNFKGDNSKLSFGDIQFKTANSTIASSNNGPVIITSEVSNNYINAFNTPTPSSNTIWQGLIYA
jgi:hypothetical protein|nr:MAG TPA: GDSL-esterase, psychrotrophic, monoethylphosphonate, HYDROLASE.35A [Bacteriophage sp.]